MVLVSAMGQVPVVPNCGGCFLRIYADLYGLYFTAIDHVLDSRLMHRCAGGKYGSTSTGQNFALARRLC